MSKDKLTDYSATNSLNTDVGGVNIDEGMLPSDVNNALREVMTHLKDFAEGTQAVNNIRFAGATTTGDINFGDNDKAVFGAGSDLEIYHDSATGNSIINEGNVSGDLVIQANNLTLKRASVANTEKYLTATANGSVDLYYDAGVKLSTTATGVDITGTLTADGLTVDGGTTDTVTNFTSTDTSAFVRFTDGTGSTYAGTTYQNGSGAFVVYTGGDTGGAGSHKSLTIDGGGDVALYDNTGSSQGFYWDASTQYLGLGTSLPDRNLHIAGNAAYAKFDDTTNGATFSVGANANGFIVYDDDASSYRMVIDSSGRVGINRTPSISNSKLEVSGADNVSLINVEASGNTGGIGIGSSGLQLFHGSSSKVTITSAGNVGIGTVPNAWRSVDKAVELPYSSFSDNSGTTTLARNAYLNSSAQWIYRASDEATRYSQNNGVHSWDTAATGTAGGTISWQESMRISGGNLLVGKTASSTAVQGIEVDGANGLLVVTRDGYPTATFNRLSSDGTILDLRKDSSTVGSVGINSSRTYIGSGSGQSGIKFNTNAIVPVAGADGANSDNTYDLGVSSARFKDLYLSGGVYLGGTGSANHLDDYEEGTFQANFSPETSGTITISSTVDTLAYTKVGRLVTITGNVSVTSVASAVGGFVHLNSLPFTSADLDEFSGRNSGSISFSDSSAGTVTSLGTLMLESSSQIRMYVDASTVAAGDAFFVSFSYITT